MAVSCIKFKFFTPAFQNQTRQATENIGESPSSDSTTELRDPSLTVLLLENVSVSSVVGGPQN